MTSVSDVGSAADHPTPNLRCAGKGIVIGVGHQRRQGVTSAAVAPT